MGPSGQAPVSGRALPHPPARSRPAAMTNHHHTATDLIHGGVHRTPHGETSEAIFLTSGFVYDNAEQAEATFAGTATHYQYSRFGNRTVAALEQRLAMLEGAEACR